jgi:fucose permease
MFFLGLGVTIVGAAARNAGIPATEVGLLLTTQHLGFFLSVAFAGSLADRYSKPIILALGSVAMAVGFGGFYLWGSFFLNAFFMFCLGVGIGVNEGVADALLLDLHPVRKSLFINLNHFFTTLGSLLITGYLIFLQMAWRLSMNQAAMAVAILALLFAVSREKRGSGGRSRSTRSAEQHSQQEAAGGASPTDAGSIRGLLRSPSVLLMGVAMIFAVGMELGSIGILTTYLMELRDFTQLTSKLGLLLFIGGFGFGRVVLGALIRDGQEWRWLLGCFAASVVTMTLLYAVTVEPLLYVFAFAAGLSVSVLLPTMIAFAGKRFSEHAGTVIGIVKMGIPLGGMLLPILLSGATAAFSLQVALFLFPVSGALGMGAVLALGSSRIIGEGRDAAAGHVQIDTPEPKQL